MDGQFVWDEENGAAVAEAFLTLDETDQQKLWDGVREYADRENWIAGEDVEEPGRPVEKPKRRTMMRPPIFSPDCLSLEETLNRLDLVRPKRDGRRDAWTARCPAHEDRSPSLLVSENDFKPGEPMFFCRAGCSHQQVKDAVMQL